MGRKEKKSEEETLENESQGQSSKNIGGPNKRAASDNSGQMGLNKHSTYGRNHAISDSCCNIGACFGCSQKGYKMAEYLERKETSLLIQWSKTRIEVRNLKFINKLYNTYTLNFGSYYL